MSALTLTRPGADLDALLSNNAERACQLPDCDRVPANWLCYVCVPCGHSVPRVKSICDPCREFASWATFTCRCGRSIKVERIESLR